MATSTRKLNFHKLLKNIKTTGGQKKFDVEKSEKLEAEIRKKKQSNPEIDEIISIFNIKQFKALDVVNKYLLICPEASRQDFPVHSYVEELVSILKQQDIEKSQPKLWNVTMSAFIKICHMFPSSGDAVVKCDGLTVLVDAYTNVVDEELAKKCLQTLEEISQVYPSAYLEAQLLILVLQCKRSIIFKRIALSMAWNICKNFTVDTVKHGISYVPFLTQYLLDRDTKVVEFSSLCLNKIVKALASSPQMLDEVIQNHGFISQAVALISYSNFEGRQASLKTPAYSALVLLLSTCASCSHLGSERLFDCGITDILTELLTGSGIFPALSRPQEQILEIVNLANELLSPLFLPVISEKQHDSFATGAVACEKLPEKRLKLLQQFGMDLLPVLMQICGSILNGPVPRKCLPVIAKLMHFSSACMISSLSSVTNISRFLAGLLAQKDPQVLISALQIADTLMNKFPATFCNIFVVEGVLHAVDTIILTGFPDVAFPQPSSCDEDSFKHAGLAVSSPPSPVEVPTSSSNIFMDVRSSAEAFKVSYAKYSPDTVDAISEELRLLKSLCLKLITFDNQKTISKGSEVGEDMTSIMSQILTTLSKGDCSTFEFIESGVVDAFLSYLSCGLYSKKNISEFSDSMLPDDMYREQATRRCKSFIAVTLPSGLQDKKTAPMSILVKYLQSALSSLERFPVVLGHGGRSAGGYGHLSSGLSALSQTCNIRLCRAKGDESLIDYSSYNLAFDPLATLAAVEEFLWPRVEQDEFIQPSASAKKSETGIVPTGARELLAQEKNDTPSKRNGKIVLTQKDESGSHMRIDGRGGAAVDKGSQMKIDEDSNDDISDNEEQDDVRGFSTTKEWREKLVASPRLTFFAGGKQLSRNMSIYEVIQRFLMDEVVNDTYNDGILGGIYTITYQRATSATNRVLVERTGTKYPCESREVVSPVDLPKQQISLLDSILNRKLTCDLDKSDSTNNILALLCVLEGLNQSSSNLHGKTIADLFCEEKMLSLNDCTETDSIIPRDIFINNQLTSKLAGQVEDALAIRSKSLPSWCCQLMKACPFLFPFEIRHQYFYLTVFQFSRGLNHLRQQKGVNGHDSKKAAGVRVGRLRHQKVRVARDRILDSVAEVMEMDDNQRKYVLEVDFFGEFDTGLEPTLEFYTLSVLELQKVALLWRSNNASVNSMMEVEEKCSKGNTCMAFDALIEEPCGLFPRSWPLDADMPDGSTFEKVAGHFKLLGRVLGKALQDKRPINMSLSSAFYKLLLGQDLNLHDIISFDPELGKNLLNYQALVDVKLYPGSRGRNNEFTETQFSENENANEDPGHDFTLPDFPFPKKVYINNLEEYIDFVFDITAGSGIKRQLDALRSGFNEVFDISSLQIFSAKELEYMLCQKK